MATGNKKGTTTGEVKSGASTGRATAAATGTAAATAQELDPQAVANVGTGFLQMLIVGQRAGMTFTIADRNREITLGKISPNGYALRDDGSNFQIQPRHVVPLTLLWAKQYKG